MLYVFIVSSGRMLEFDMKLAVEKVSELKNEIARCTRIKVEQQVLLCSGGEELISEKMVATYHGAGTDTNPIFLFKKYKQMEQDWTKERIDKEIKNEVPSHLRELLDKSIDNDVKGSANMTPGSQAVYVQLSLSERFAELALKALRECEELVHNQHLQQQGWAAVIANLEDAKENLLKKKYCFEELFQKYLSNRTSYLDTINMFPTSVEILSKIPLLPQLMISNECVDEDSSSKHTLLSWFMSEPADILENLVEKCRRLVEELNECTWINLEDSFDQVLRNVNNTEMKVIKGIEGRLDQLNSKLESARNNERDQRRLTSWFKGKKDTIVKDPHSLPALFNTFQSQLEIMLGNHENLRKILDQCNQAKNQLTDTIVHRLRIISNVESEMYQLLMRIHFLENHVQSVMRQVESYHQVQLAPERYLRLLAEVCRRRAFSANFMKWATELSTEASKMYHKEIDIRKSFTNIESRNMVDNLFPGMNDVPPPFAVDCPQPFDQYLPNIIKEELEWLKINLPELSHCCDVVLPDPMPYISQTEMDSAFSSNVPSSRVVSDSTALSEKVSSKEDLHSDKLAVPSGDFYSLPSEYASLPNEVFSLTSSPFEDPLLPSHMQEQRTKTLQFSDKCASGEQIGTMYSDGEEFETVESYRTSPVATTAQSILKPRARPTSSSDVIDVNNMSKLCSKVSKARSDGDAVSPMQERLKSPDSFGVSSDFQAAEYYIDDSMPSSYTESNATSPLMRGNRMVKSHHVVVAELQRQVEEKSGALIVTKSSLENTHSNVLKLHAKLSALQKFIQELQGKMKSDFSEFKSFVSEDLSSQMTEVADIVNYINSYVEKMEEIVIEKESAINEARNLALTVETAYSHKMEVENQKLNDAEKQICNYEERLKDLHLSCNEIKHDKDILNEELQQKNEEIQKMMLEHELDIDSMKQKVDSQEVEIDNLKKKLSDAYAEITKLRAENESLAKDSEEHSSVVTTIQDERNSLTDEINRLKEENRCIKDLQNLQNDLELALKEKNQSMKELEEAREHFNKLKEEMELVRATELKEVEEKLNIKHKSEIESLRSRFKLAISMTSMEKSIAQSIPEDLDTESLGCFEELKQIIADNQEKWNKLKFLEELTKEMNALKESAEETQLKHEEEKAQIIKAFQLKLQSSFEKCRTHITAENQVVFNEAINNLAKEKDSVIESLRSQVSILDQKLHAIKAYLDQSLVGFSEGLGSGMTRSESGASSALTTMNTIDEFKHFNKFKMDIEVLLQSRDTTKSSYQMRSATDCSESLRKMSSSARHSCVQCFNKISILSCEPGDVVLVYYEEKLEHFMIYHLGSHLHFLHLDCVAALNLQIPSGSEAQKWLMGKVTHKEFCVTKKKNNRFKLKLGTRFYRVKIERWQSGIIATRNAESALEQSIMIPSDGQLLASQSMLMECSIPRLSAESTEIQPIASGTQPIASGTPPNASGTQCMASETQRRASETPNVEIFSKDEDCQSSTYTPLSSL